MKRGQQRRLPAASGPQDFHHVIGGYNWCTDQVSYLTTSSKNSERFIAFLEHLLLAVYPHQTVVLVMDNVSYHRSRAVKAALSLFEHRVRVVFLPVYCPDLNMIERFWRHLKDLVSVNRLFPSLQTLIDQIHSIMSIQNERTHPLRLTFLKDFR
jgi:putative transposase